MNILGISCFYHDSAAALLRDGDLVAAAHEDALLGEEVDPILRVVRFRLRGLGEQGKPLLALTGVSQLHSVRMQPLRGTAGQDDDQAGRFAQQVKILPVRFARRQALVQPVNPENFGKVDIGEGGRTVRVPVFIRPEEIPIRAAQQRLIARDAAGRCRAVAHPRS